MSDPRAGSAPQRTDASTLPKLCGGDYELGNFILGGDGSRDTGHEASRALLNEIGGVPCSRSYPYRSGDPDAHSWWGSASAAEDPQDWGRRFLPGNGGSVYVDLDHLELCLPEVLSAFDHVAAYHAMLRVARAALAAANRKQPPGQRIQVLVNNSDGLSHSYGGHLNVLVTRRAWDDLFHHRLHHQLFLASCQVASIVVTGQGKVGAENGAPAVDFQISQRADFFQTLSGVQTTFNRPLVNSRDEALTGSGGRAEGGMARLHSIFPDTSLAHGSCLLRVGIPQIVLAMIEAERVNPRLILQDPVATVRRWSHDPGLSVRAPLLSGEQVSAVRLLRLFFDEAAGFVGDGHCEGIVPRAGEILALWGDTLDKLEARDFAALARRLDWICKLRTLRRAMQRRPELDWKSPEIRHLDQLYSSLDPDEGIYWAYEAAGAVERVVDEERIAHFVHQPPEDTRAWTRAMLLRSLDPDSIVSVDWDQITVRRPRGAYGSALQKFELGNPLAFTRK